MLKKIKKGLTPEIVIRAANFGKKSKIVFSYSFIVNLPTETTDELLMTFSLAKKLLAIKPNSFVSAVHHYFAYPGTVPAAGRRTGCWHDSTRNGTNRRVAHGPGGRAFGSCGRARHGIRPLYCQNCYRFAPGKCAR